MAAKKFMPYVFKIDLKTPEVWVSFDDLTILISSPPPFNFTESVSKRFFLTKKFLRNGGTALQLLIDGGRSCKSSKVKALLNPVQANPRKKKIVFNVNTRLKYTN